MIELNLTTKSKEQELIKAYLQANASEILADKINNGVRIIKENKELVSKKDLDRFFSYANSEAKKLAKQDANSICIEDKTVYGWAIHYFEEDSIEGKLFNLDGTEFKVAKKVTDQSPIYNQSSVIKTQKSKQNDNAQQTLFDLMTDEDRQIELEEQENERQEEIALSEDNEESNDEESDDLTFEEMDEILAEGAEEEAKQKAKTNGTPLYQRYMTVQNAYPNCIVCMRLGDFYEFFGESAKTISSELDLTLTGRDCGLTDRTPMCGIPYHAADNYFNKIRQNHNLVIIESDKDSDNKYLNKFVNNIQHKNEEIDLETGEILNANATVDNELINKLKAIFGDDMEVRL